MDPPTRASNQSWFCLCHLANIFWSALFHVLSRKKIMIQHFTTLYFSLHHSNLVLLFNQGYVSLISVDGLHQIHILIFFLAVLHVIYSAITMAFGRLKVILVALIIHLLLYISSHLWRFFFWEYTRQYLSHFNYVYFPETLSSVPLGLIVLLISNFSSLNLLSDHQTFVFFEIFLHKRIPFTLWWKLYF